MEDDEFPWFRHSTSFYLKRRVVEHKNLASGKCTTMADALLARCVLLGRGAQLNRGYGTISLLAIYS